MDLQIVPQKLQAQMNSKSPLVIAFKDSNKKYLAPRPCPRTLSREKDATCALDSLTLPCLSPLNSAWMTYSTFLPHKSLFNLCLHHLCSGHPLLNNHSPSSPPVELSLTTLPPYPDTHSLFQTLWEQHRILWENVLLHDMANRDNCTLFIEI